MYFSGEDSRLVSANKKQMALAATLKIVQSWKSYQKTGPFSWFECFGSSPRGLRSTSFDALDKSRMKGVPEDLEFSAMLSTVSELFGDLRW